MSTPLQGTIIDILLVEDNPDDVELTREALAESKMANRLHVARTAEEAQAFLDEEQETQPDLILLDINLPGISGLEFLKRIKSSDRDAGIPVVMLTTSQAEEDILEAYKAHASAFVSKPVDFGTFIEVVKEIRDFYVTIVSLPSKSRHHPPEEP